MNAIKIFFLLLFFAGAINAQVNLVPNPSFEDTVYCPTGNNQIDACQHWHNFGNSPDYFNACSNPVFAVPNAIFGFQYPHTGNAYAGLVCYLHPNAAPPPNHREFLGVELFSTLQVGQKYFVSFYLVNPGSFNIAIACNKIGINFFTTSFDSCCPPQTLNYSKLYSDSIFIDTLNWIKLSGSFIADSAYKFLAIGNFFDDQNTDTINMQPFPYQAYYYIDDVCLSTDSLYNETWTGLQNSELNDIHIWPNPIQNYFQFSATQNIDEVTIYDSRGKLIKCENVNALEGRIEFDVLSEGIYFAIFRRESDVSVHKFLKF